eukprot:TRINITY_DN28342_c0_g1_i2.p2 TRINITY_DN28342_c0_g1~~TRINITY_DN28342_c0_g1_i2.p2  ORF type:complete len:138 (+),score=5.91 TRINITY_DN28342_c0_g1_i2:82-495(+)
MQLCSGSFGPVKAVSENEFIDTIVIQLTRGFFQIQLKKKKIIIMDDYYFNIRGLQGCLKIPWFELQFLKIMLTKKLECMICRDGMVLTGQFMMSDNYFFKDIFRFSFQIVTIIWVFIDSRQICSNFQYMVIGLSIFG